MQYLLPSSQHIKFLLFVLVTCWFIVSNAEAQTIKEQSKTTTFPSSDFKNANIYYKIIPSLNNTWGYEILVENKKIISQPTIPGFPGNEGFKTKESAEKVAKLVIGKLKNGEIPPSVTIEEMKKIKAL